MEITATIIICIVCVIGLIVSVLVKPNIETKNGSFPIFWIVPFVCALLLVIIGLAPLEKVTDELVSSSSVNPAKILIIFFSMSFISIYLDQQGFFKYVANKAVKKATGSQLKLFLVIFGLTSLLTVFTSNDIVILTFVPFVCYFCKNAKISPIPYIVSTFVSANTWSMMLIIGNPTNIYLATSAGIKFIDYFKEMALPTLGAGVTELVILLLLFRKSLNVKIDVSANEEVRLKKLNTIVGVSILVACILLLVISSYIDGLEMWLVCAIAAIVLLIFAIVSSVLEKEFKWTFAGFFKHLPWELIPFVLSMFVAVLALKEQGISQMLYDFLKDLNPYVGFGISSFLAANIINNIPMSILYSTICNSSSDVFLAQVYSSIVGSNLGAFLSPLGALAGIMFTNIVKKQDIKYSFVSFIKYGVLIGIPTLAVTLLLLAL